MLKATRFLKCEASFQSNTLLARFLGCFNGKPHEVRDHVKEFLRRDIDTGCFTCSFNGVVSCDGRPIEEYLNALTVPFDLEGAAFTPHQKKAAGHGLIAIRHTRDLEGWKADGRRLVYPFTVAIETTDRMRIGHLAFRCRLREALQSMEGSSPAVDHMVWM